MRIHNYIYMHARMIILIDPLVSCDDEISIIYGVILMLSEGARVFFLLRAGE